MSVETRLNPHLPLAFNAQYEIDKRNFLTSTQFYQREERLLNAYILEHVVREQITSYDYKLDRDSSGKVANIFVPGFNEYQDITESFKQAKGRRVDAEYQGFLKVKEKISLPDAIGSWFVINSPPGNPEEGFPGHNFAFIGRVGDDSIDAWAYRNYLSKGELAKFSNKFLPDPQALSSASQDTDFISTPVFLPKELGVSSFGEVIGLLDNSTAKLEDHSDLLRQLHPLREKAISALQSGSKQDIINSLSALENYAQAIFSDEQIREFSYYSTYSPKLTVEECGIGGIFFENSTVETYLPGWTGVIDRKDKFNKFYCIKCGACGEKIEQVVLPGEKCPKLLCKAVRICA